MSLSIRGIAHWLARTASNGLVEGIAFAIFAALALSLWTWLKGLSVPLAILFGVLCTFILSLSAFFAASTYRIFTTKDDTPRPEDESQSRVYMSVEERQALLDQRKQANEERLSTQKLKDAAEKKVLEQNSVIEDYRKYDWLRQIADQDKQNIQHLVKVFLIDWNPRLSDDIPNPYIDFGFGIFNGSVYDVEVLNPLKGYITFWRSGKDNPDGFKDPPRLKLEEGQAPPVVFSRSARGVWVRQWLTEKEAQFIESSTDNGTFWFSELVISMKGAEFEFRLYTGERMKKGKVWRSYDNPSTCLAYSHSDLSVEGEMPATLSPVEGK